MVPEVGQIRRFNGSMVRLASVTPLLKMGEHANVWHATTECGQTIVYACHDDMLATIENRRLAA